MNTSRFMLARQTRFAAALLALIACAHVQAAADGPSVQRLMDIAEITQLRARYINAIDNRRWTELRDSILTSDSVTDLPASVVRGAQAEGRVKLEGSQATIDFMRSVLGDEPGSNHAVTTPMIEVTSATTASATWRLGTASYFDTYEKIDGRWRIKSVRFEPTIPGPSRPRPEKK